jgi:hypothetical protein
MKAVTFLTAPSGEVFRQFRRIASHFQPFARTELRQGATQQHSSAFVQCKIFKVELPLRFRVRHEKIRRRGPIVQFPDDAAGS